MTKRGIEGSDGESAFRREERERNEALRVAFETALAERWATPCSATSRKGGAGSESSELDTAMLALLRAAGGARDGRADSVRADRAAPGPLSGCWSPEEELEQVSGQQSERAAERAAGRAHAHVEETHHAASSTAQAELSSSELKSLDRRLRDASRRTEGAHAEMLELLLRFDEAKGWRSTGAKHCAAWMNSELGICTGLAWEKLRVARAARSADAREAVPARTPRLVQDPGAGAGRERGQRDRALRDGSRSDGGGGGTQLRGAAYRTRARRRGRRDRCGPATLPRPHGRLARACRR